MFSCSGRYVFTGFSRIDFLFFFFFVVFGIDSRSKASEGGKRRGGRGFERGETRPQRVGKRKSGKRRRSTRQRKRGTGKQARLAKKTKKRTRKNRRWLRSSEVQRSDLPPQTFSGPTNDREGEQEEEEGHPETGAGGREEGGRERFQERRGRPRRLRDGLERGSWVQRDPHTHATSAP